MTPRTTNLLRQLKDAEWFSHVGTGSISEVVRTGETPTAILMKTSDIVVVVGHGPGNRYQVAGDYYDNNGKPFSGIHLGGNQLLPADAQLHQGGHQLGLTGAATVE